MITPGTASLTIYSGGTFNQEFDFWDDALSTVPHSFSGWTLSMTITWTGPSHPGPVTCTVTVASNVVTVSLTPSITASMQLGAAHWVLQEQNNTTGEVEFLMHGDIEVVTP
jgi:hypothetical protein